MSAREQEIKIGERKFTIRTLSYGKAKPLYMKLQAILVAYADDKYERMGLGVIPFAMNGGALTEEDLDLLVETFGEVTTVSGRTPDGQPTTLKLDQRQRDAIFAGAFEDMFEWLEACVKLNFEGVIKKYEAAKSAIEAAAENQTSDATS